mmetsp:Transcript_75674/g.244855  ORF Transcript_75674/g.244855 Transcript_75674/m.244855 type:complete len:313 (+) Transcript_75674:746-1684(+)
MATLLALLLRARSLLSLQLLRPPDDAAHDAERPVSMANQLPLAREARQGLVQQLAREVEHVQVGDGHRHPVLPKVPLRQQHVDAPAGVPGKDLPAMDAQAPLDDIEPVVRHDRLLGAEQCGAELHGQLNDECRPGDLPKPPDVAEPGAVDHVHELDRELRVHPRHDALHEGRAAYGRQLLEVLLHAVVELTCEGVLPAHVQHGVQLLLVMDLVHARMLHDAHHLTDDSGPNEGAAEHHHNEVQVLRHRGGDDVTVADAGEGVEGEVEGRDVRHGCVLRVGFEGVIEVVAPVQGLPVHELLEPVLPHLVVAQS